MSARIDMPAAGPGGGPGGLLDGIADPSALRALPEALLPRVADELRRELLDAIARTGGHLGASLGVVELTVALHYVLDTPRDRLLFDVGHQGHPHKLLTGRRREFAAGPGRPGGIGKFLRRAESAHDVFGAGHAGTSVSAAVGIAEAIRRRGGSELAVAVIGDGAATAGMAFEGLNHGGFLELSPLVVVLNDNGMSISPNVGALSRSLAEGARGVEGFFGALGFDYRGPVDGHDLPELVAALRPLRGRERGGRPVLLHVRTEKGHGYAPAAADPVRYHGVTAFDTASGRMQAAGSATRSWTTCFAEDLVELADGDERIVAITAAMEEGTGLARFRRAHGDRCYDVGIAEQHAVTMAAGMATEGLKPVCAIYSTFLQRAYDQVVHDVCVQGLDVTFVLDRAGLVGADGATHQGVYDYAYLRSLPHMVVMAPRDAAELRRMLRTAVLHPGPAALRFPRGAAVESLGPASEEAGPLAIGESELLRDGGDVALLAVGACVAPAWEAGRRLARAGVDAAVLDARFVKPLDERRILALAERTGAVVTVEEHVGAGGFGEAVAALLSRRGAGGACRQRLLALPDQVLEHGDRATTLAEHGLDVEGIVGAACDLLAAGEDGAGSGRIPWLRRAGSGRQCREEHRGSP